METLTRLLFSSTSTTSSYNFQSIEPPKKYFIDDLDSFWQLYDQIYKEKNQNLELFLLEHPNLSYSILRFDIDIKPKDSLDVDKSRRLYNENDVQLIIRRIFELISLTSGKECDEKINHMQNFICCLLEKNDWDDKDGFHLIFPNLFVAHHFQDNYFVNKLNIFLSTFNETYDYKADRVSSKAWVVLGSKKKSNSSLYYLTRTYDKSLNIIDKDLYLKPSKFSLNKVSTNVFGRRIIQRPILKRVRPKEDIQKDLNIIIKNDILNNLSPHRREDYDAWIEIGIILFNIGNGSDEFLDLWKDFSSTSILYQEDVCEKKWRSFEVRNITIRTLFFFLKQDNPEYFKTINAKRMTQDIYNSLFPFDSFEEGTTESFFQQEMLKKKSILDHYDIVNILVSKYSSDYIWASEKKNKGMWFQFIGSRWILISEGNIRIEIVKLDKYFTVLCLDIFEEVLHYENQKQIKEYVSNNCNRLKKQLKNNSFVTSCAIAARDMFKKDDFFQIIDSNKHLIGCENGVLDFDKCIFRTTTPEDYITFSTKIHFSKPSDDDIEELEEYLSKIFTNEELRKNVIEIIASKLCGNNDKKIIIALGKTNAGKSIFVRLLEKTLGEYTFTFPKEIAYQRSSISSASARPELARSPGKRFAMINELENSQNMNCATMKELGSGNDRIYARKLYQEGCEFEPMFTMYLSCNEIPRIPQDDEAMWNRILIITFSSRFDNERAPDNITEQRKKKIFPLEKNIDEKLNRLAPTFLWYLFQTYKANKEKYNDEVPISRSIRDATNKFREENNIVYKFVIENVSISDENGSFISCGKMFNRFTAWYKECYPDRKLRTSRDVFKEEFVKFSGSETVKYRPEGATKRIEGWKNIVFGEKNDD